MIRGISKPKLGQVANFIEEETFLDEDVALETHRNCLLPNFPIMYAVKLGATFYSNKRHLIMQSDAFVAKQKEQAAEQTNVSQTKKRKRNLSSFPMQKEVESIFGKNSHL